MKLEIGDIINKHKNKPGIVIGHGPSLNQHIHKLDSNKNNGFILFDCNDWYNFGEPSTHPHYWILSNTEQTIEREIYKLNTYLVPVLYADTVDITDRKWIAQNIKCDYLPYDNRHFDSKTQVTICGSGCCSHLIPGRLTVQEELKKHTGYCEHFSGGDTVLLYSISFAILVGCNPVYITGMDLDYRKGYAKSNTYLEVSDGGVLDIYRENLLNDLKIINDSAKNIGTRLVNLNKNSFFDTIEIGSIK